jgi:hypothetical protein
MTVRTPASERRTSESKMALAITRILRRAPEHKLTMADIRHMVPRFVRLTAADRAESPTRPGEELWMQVIRNIRSHGSGRQYGLRVIPGGFALTVNPSAAVVERLTQITADAKRRQREAHQ